MGGEKHRESIQMPEGKNSKLLYLKIKYTFWSYDPRRVGRVSHTTTRQLSSPAASEVASSEVSAIAEVKFAPLAVQVMISLGRT